MLTTRILLVLLLFSASSAVAQTEKKTSVGLIYEAIAATSATLWLAEELRLFEKYGLDAKVIHARGAIPVQALVSGSVEFGVLGGPSAVAAAFAGADLVFVAAKGNFAVMSIWVKKDSPIRTVAELRGKNIGVTRAGSATHTIARLALSSKRAASFATYIAETCRDWFEPPLRKTRSQNGSRY